MNKRNSTATLHSKIAEYWFGRGICKDGTLIEDAIASNESDVLSVFSLGTMKPHCWACGAEYEGELGVTSDKTLFACYDRSSAKLNRCHIIAKQFGGSDEPSNLFLMCENCHRESPDTKNKPAFFRWIYERRHLYTKGLRINGLYLDIAKEMSARGFSIKDFDKALSMAIIDRSEREINLALEKVKDKIGRDMGQHGFYIAPTTTVISAVDGLEDLLLQLVL